MSLRNKITNGWRKLENKIGNVHIEVGSVRSDFPWFHYSLECEWRHTLVSTLNRVSKGKTKLGFCVTSQLVLVCHDNTTR